MMKRQFLSKGFILCALVTALAVSGCSRAAVYEMDSGERTAGADGKVEVTRDGNGNRVVSLNVAHLPMPSRLDEGASTYVVWISPEESNYQYNMGQLRLTKDRTGTITFTTPFNTFEMVVTAEIQGNVLAPSKQVVLRRGIAGGN